MRMSTTTMMRMIRMTQKTMILLRLRPVIMTRRTTTNHHHHHHPSTTALPAGNGAWKNPRSLYSSYAFSSFSSSSPPHQHHRPYHRCDSSFSSTSPELSSSSSSSSSSSPSSSSSSSVLSTSSSSSLVSWHVHERDPRIGVITLRDPSSYNALTVDMGLQFQALCQSLIRALHTTPPPPPTTTTTPHTHTTTATTAAVATTKMTTSFSSSSSSSSSSELLSAAAAEGVGTLEGAEQVQVVLLQGAGGQAFSAGGNLSWLHSLRHNTVPANASAMMQFYQSFLGSGGGGGGIRSIPVPVVAVLHGPAMGAGAALALAADVRVAASDVSHLLGFHFVKLGIHAGMGASHYLPQVLGGGRGGRGGSTGLVNEILLTGQVLSSEQAYRYGLINHLTTDSATHHDHHLHHHDDNNINQRNDHTVTSTSLSSSSSSSSSSRSLADRQAAVDELAYTVAQQFIIGRHPLAVRLTLQTLRQQQDVGLQAALEREAWMQAVCYHRQDWGRGVTAVANKTVPDFDSYHAP